MCLLQLIFSTSRSKIRCEVENMKRVILLCLTVLIGTVFFASTVGAENFPASRSQTSQPPRLSKSQVQQRLYYGYVPPPPIQHTWPGGYRVIVHEMMNSIMEHLLGRY